jgi:hypothetical protein
VGNSYQIIPSIGTLQSADYLFSFRNGTLTITPAPLTIEANNTSQVLGTTPSLSASYIGLVNGDTAASLTTPAVVSTTATANSLPGAYPITVAGASSPNYSITYKSGTYTVEQSPTSSSLVGPTLRSAATSPVTFTVDVVTYTGSSIPLTGHVAFYDQAGVIGTAPVVNGVATLTTAALAKGNYMIYAAYQGDTNYSPSSTGTIEQIIMSNTPAAPAKKAAPTATHSKKATPKPKAPAPKAKAKAHTAVTPKAVPATKPPLAVAVKTLVKQIVKLTKRKG